MASLQEALLKLEEHAGKSEDRVVKPMTPEEETSYAARLTKSLSYLQKQIQHDESEIQKRRENNPIISIEHPAEDPRLRIRQLQAITAAYKSVTESEPMLPSADSPLPALIALRESLVTVDQLKRSIKDCRTQIADTQAHLSREYQDLEMARSMSAALEARIRELQSEKEELDSNGAEHIATKIWQDLQQKNAHYVKELKRLVLAFKKFTDDHLAIMLAAEDLGGPVVGDDLNLDREVLEGGFTKQGRPKKSGKIQQQDDASDLDLGKREMQDPVSSTRLNIAAEEFRKLTEDLMNAAADESRPDPYIQIKKESAAVRFLVRAKVAQFHPDDARKLRLMDFGNTAEHNT